MVLSSNYCLRSIRVYATSDEMLCSSCCHAEWIGSAGLLTSHPSTHWHKSLTSVCPERGIMVQTSMKALTKAPTKKYNNAVPTILNLPCCYRIHYLTMVSLHLEIYQILQYRQILEWAKLVPGSP